MLLPTMCSAGCLIWSHFVPERLQQNPRSVGTCTCHVPSQGVGASWTISPTTTTVGGASKKYTRSKVRTPKKVGVQRSLCRAHHRALLIRFGAAGVVLHTALSRHRRQLCSARRPRRTAHFRYQRQVYVGDDHRKYRMYVCIYYCCKETKEQQLLY